MNIDADKLLDEAEFLVSMNMFNHALLKYNYIVENIPDSSEAYLMRGAVLGKLGKINRAIDDLERSIQLDDTKESSYVTLAQLYLKKNDEHHALNLCNQAVEKNDNNINAKKLLINLCYKLGNQALELSLFDKAKSYFSLSLEHHPDDTNTLYRQALVFRGLGKIEESIKYSKKAIAINSENIRAKAFIASAYELLGQIKKGSQLIEQLINEYPNHPFVCIVYAQYALRNKKQQDGINILSNMLEKTNLDTFDDISVKMLLGTLFDSIEQYDSAFTYYKQANDLQNSNYDSTIYQAYITNLIEYFTVEKYQAIPFSECSSDELIFIVGFPRSGSTLIEQILASHSTVYAGGELTHVHHLVDHIQDNIESGKSYPLCLDDISLTKTNQLASELLNSIRSENKSNAKVLKFIDKMPNNFHHIGLLYKLYPNAKFINCERDSRDTCLSCYFQYFAGHHPYASSLRNLAIHYREYKRLMQHWASTLNIPIVTVIYEDVIFDTKKQIEMLLNFLDLKWEDNCLEFHKNKRIVTTASYNQVNKKIYSRSIGRWKHYEKHIKELADEL